MRTFKAIDLFAGAGGFSLGMQQAGFDVVVAVEIEQAACDTLRATLQYAHLFCLNPLFRVFPHGLYNKIHIASR